MKMMPARARPPMIATTTDSGARPFPLFIIAGICTMSSATNVDICAQDSVPCRLLPQLVSVLVAVVVLSVADIIYIYN